MKIALHATRTLGLLAVWLGAQVAGHDQESGAAPERKRAADQADQRQPAGELRLHPQNPRYFVDAGRPVVLIGRYHADFICSTDEHFTRDLPGYMKYLADELNANFTQVWAIMIFSGRKEAEYGVNTGGAMFMPFRRTGPGTNHYGEPKYDLSPDNKDWVLHLKVKQ